MTKETGNDLNGLILNAIDIPVTVLDHELRCIAWNNEMEELTGIEANNAIKKSIYELFPQIESGEKENAFQHVLETGQTKTIQHSFIANDTTRKISMELKPFQKGVLIIPREHVPDTESDEKSDNFENFNSLFIAQVPQAVAMVDMNMIYLSASKEWHDMYGFGESEMIGRCHYDLFPEIRNMPEWLEFHKRCLKGESIKKDKDFFGRENGKDIWIRWEIRPWHHENGEIGGMIMFSEEVSENVEQFLAMESTLHELNESEALLSSLYQNNPLTMTIVDSNYEINNTNYIFPGIEKEDIVGKTVLEFTENKFHTLLKDSINQVFKTGKTTNFATYKKCPEDGKLCWFENYLGPIYKDGKVTLVSINAVNITEKIALENERIIATEQFRHVFDNIADLICLHHPDGTYENVSPSIQEIAGYDANDMVGKNPYDFFHPEDIKRIMEESHKPVAEQTVKKASIEYRYRHKEGHYLWFLTSTQVIKDQEGNVLKLVTSTKDISHKKQLEEERNREINEVSEQRDMMAVELEQQLEAMDVSSIVSITDVNGKITYVNQEFCKISGYSQEELLGQDHIIINSGYHIPGFFKGMLQELGQGKVWKGNICNKAKDGSIYWVKTTIYPFKNAQGKIEKFISVRFDITQMKNQSEVLEKQATELERAKSVLSENLQREIELNELKSRFVATASHQFRTPLTVIQANMGVLTMSSEWINEDFKDRFNLISDRITSQITKMTEMMDEVLILSKIRSGGTKVKKDYCDVVEMCQKLVNNFNEIGNSNKVEQHISGEVRAFCMDPRLFEDSISNFISNGIKYSPKDEPVLVELNFSREALTISICDNGMGIPKNELDRFFEPFFRGSNVKDIEGTGLGTSIAKEYIELMDGDATVESEQGKGTIVRIRFKDSNDVDCDKS